MTERLLLTVREVAELLGIRPGSVYHWVSQGRLPCIRLSSRCLRFRREDLDEWLAGLAQRADQSLPRDQFGTMRRTVRQDKKVGALELNNK